MKLRKKSFCRHQKLDLSTLKGRLLYYSTLYNNVTIQYDSLSLYVALFCFSTRFPVQAIWYTHTYTYRYYYAVHNVEGVFFFFLVNGGLFFVFCFFKFVDSFRFFGLVTCYATIEGDRIAHTQRSAWLESRLSKTFFI